MSGEDLSDLSCDNLTDMSCEDLSSLSLIKPEGGHQIGYDGTLQTSIRTHMSTMTYYLKGMVTQTITQTLTDAKTQQIKDLLVSLGASTQKCKSLSDNIKTLQTEIDTLGGKNDVLDGTNKSLVSENTGFREKIKLLESRVSLLTTTLDQTNISLAEAKAKAEAERDSSTQWCEKWKTEKAERQKFEKWWNDDAYLRRKEREGGCIVS